MTELKGIRLSGEEQLMKERHSLVSTFDYYVDWSCNSGTDSILMMCPLLRGMHLLMIHIGRTFIKATELM